MNKLYLGKLKCCLTVWSSCSLLDIGGRIVIPGFIQSSPTLISATLPTSTFREPYIFVMILLNILFDIQNNEEKSPWEKKEGKKKTNIDHRYKIPGLINNE